MNKKEISKTDKTVKTVKSSGKSSSFAEIFKNLFKKITGIFSESRMNLNFIRKIKIRWRLIIAFLLLSIIPLLIMGFSALNKSRTALTSTIKQYTAQVVAQFNTITTNEMTKNMEVADSIAFSTLVQDNFPKYETLEMFDRISLHNNLTKEFIYKTSQNSSLWGILFYPFTSTQRIFAGSSTFGIEYDDVNNMFIETTEQTKWYTDESGRVIYVTKVINVDNGKFLGNMILAIQPTVIDEIFNAFDLGESVQVLLLTQEGQIIYANREDLAKGSLYPQADLMKIIKEDLETKDTLISSQEINLVEKADCNYAKIDKTPFYVVTITPHKYIYSSSNSIGRQIAVVAAIVIPIAVILAFLISSSISSPLTKLVNLMRKAKQGNFSEVLLDKSKDEIGEVISNYDDMICNIKSLIQKVKHSVENVLNSSGKISSSSDQTYKSSEQIAITLQEVARGSSEQAEEVSQSATYMNDLSDGINKVTSDLSEVSALISGTEGTSTKAIITVRTLNDKADQSKRASQKIVEEISSLNIDMKEIRKIVKVIVGIAEQTNLLSLNAAIEAARAGEAGLGFMVVAEEVKKLADRSKEASIMINNIINSINSKTEHAVSEAYSSSNIIQDQMSAVEQTDSAFNMISTSMKEIMAHMNNMEASVGSMLTLREKTMSSMENISAVSEEAAATSEEISASTEEQMANAEILSNLSKGMNEMASELENAISLFVID